MTFQMTMAVKRRKKRHWYLEGELWGCKDATRFFYFGGNTSYSCHASEEVISPAHTSDICTDFFKLIKHQMQLLPTTGEF